MVVIHKKSSIHLGQEAISKIRSCFYIEEEQNKYNSTKVQLESLRSGNLLVGLPPIGALCNKAWNWRPESKPHLCTMTNSCFRIAKFYNFCFIYKKKSVTNINLWLIVRHDWSWDHQKINLILFLVIFGEFAPLWDSSIFNLLSLEGAAPYCL